MQQGQFLRLEKLAILNVSKNPQKKRWGVGDSWLVILRWLHQEIFIADRYPNKDKYDSLSGIIITRREVIRFTRREQLCIFMQHEEFEDHMLHCVKMWVIVNIEVYDRHVFEDSE